MLNFEPRLVPQFLSRVHNLEFLLYIQAFRVNIGISGAIGLQKKIFKDTNPILPFWQFSFLKKKKIIPLF